MRGARAVALLVIVPFTACIVELPPPQVPEQILPRPDVVLGPTAPGQGDVLIDTVGGPADVIDGSTATTVCQTPCEVHLTEGLHELHFVDATTKEWRGDGRITVGARPSAYRYAVGHQDVSNAGLLVGGTLLVTGLSLLLTSALIAGEGEGESGILIGGVVTTVLGAVGLYLLRPHVQRGVGVQWTPSPSDSRAPGADLR